MSRRVTDLGFSVDPSFGPVTSGDLSHLVPSRTLTLPGIRVFIGRSV